MIAKVEACSAEAQRQLNSLENHQRVIPRLAPARLTTTIAAEIIQNADPAIPQLTPIFPAALKPPPPAIPAAAPEDPAPVPVQSTSNSS